MYQRHAQQAYQQVDLEVNHQRDPIPTDSNPVLKGARCPKTRNFYAAGRWRKKVKKSQKLSTSLTLG